jgi:predicted house-cleaning noncanonical NTP pyrophosphatase (MazG superfamily)
LRTATTRSKDSLNALCRRLAEEVEEQDEKIDVLAEELLLEVVDKIMADYNHVSGVINNRFEVFYYAKDLHFETVAELYAHFNLGE